MKRSFVGRYFELVLDGSEPAGFVASVDYGGIKGELLAQSIGSMPFKAKHIHNPTVEPVTVKMGLSMSKDVFEWIEKSWKGECIRKNGSIITFDHDLNPVYEYQFFEALILETTIPTLDAASKEPFYITVKFQPERAEHLWGGSGARNNASLLPTVQKQILPSNFALEIDGMETDRVSKIEQFVVKQNVKPLACGPDWMYQLEPTMLEYPNLTVTFSMANSSDWFDWHKGFLVGGLNDPSSERTGSITLYAQNMSTGLFEVDLKGLGVVNIIPEKSDNASTSDVIRRVKAELYCEEMSFEFLSEG